MPSVFDQIIEQVLINEGSHSEEINGWYTKDGSVTVHGINYKHNAAVLHTIGIKSPEDMGGLTREAAKVLYRAHYWEALGLSNVNVIPTALAYQILDMSVTSWIDDASRILQKSINQVIGTALKIDGKIGELTRGALLRTILSQRAIFLTEACKVWRFLHYIDLFSTKTRRDLTKEELRQCRNELVSWTRRVTAWRA
jgi:lysozyme family protein